MIKQYERIRNSVPIEPIHKNLFEISFNDKRLMEYVKRYKLTSNTIEISIVLYEDDFESILAKCINDEIQPVKLEMYNRIGDVHNVIEFFNTELLDFTIDGSYEESELLEMIMVFKYPRHATN